MNFYWFFCKKTNQAKLPLNLAASDHQAFEFYIYIYIYI